MKNVIGKQDIPRLIIMVIIGLALTFLGFAKIKKVVEAKRWPVTNGTVMSSEIAGVSKYYPSITYTYTIDSVVYNSNIISNINFNTKNRSVVEEFLKNYPLDSEIKVHYNKLKPSDAILEPGTNTGHILLLAFGVFILAIPVFEVIFSKMNTKK